MSLQNRLILCLLLFLIAGSLQSQSVPQLRPVIVLPVGSEVFFGSIQDVGVFPDGRIAVNDSRSHTIHVFFSTGEYSTSVGREGRGPGEIASGHDMVVNRAGHILLMDLVNLRLSEWNDDLEFVGSRRIPAGKFVMGMGPYGDSLILRLHDFAERRNIIAVSEGNTGGNEWSFRTLLEWVEGSDEGISCMYCYFMAKNRRFIMPVGDTIYGVAEYDATGQRVNYYARNDLPAVRRSESELSRMRSAMNRMAAAEGGSSSSGPSPFKPRFPRNSMGIDAAGRVWLMPAPRDGDPTPEVDVFDGDSFVGSVTVAAGVTGLWVHDNLVMAAYEDEVGEPRLAIYEIVD